MNSGILLVILSISSGYFLKTTPGTMSQALGAMTTVIDEGFTAFHNPALTDRTECAFSLARYLYATNMFSCSGTFQRNVLGLRYLNYGPIQGYDMNGNETQNFTPFCMDLILGRKIGPAAIHVKGFIETIDTYRITGVCGGISLFYEINSITMGFKVDNIGKVVNKTIDIPIVTALGSRISLPGDIYIYLETKGFPIEGSGGVSYYYENIGLFLGSRYIVPSTRTGEKIQPSTDDIHFSAGLHISIENYVIGYGFVYTTMSTGHHFSISCTP